MFGVHTALLYDGSEAKLFLFRNHALVYNLDNADSATVNLRTNPPANDHNVFCAGYAPIADGRLVIVGGSFDDWNTDAADSLWTAVTVGYTTFFDPSDDPITPSSFAASTDMPPSSGAVNDSCGTDPSMARYYPTCTTLPDGRILVTGGDFWTDCNNDGGWGEQAWTTGDHEIEQQRRIAIFDPESETWEVDGVDFTHPWTPSGDEFPRMFSYPNVKVLPYGLFWDGNDGPYQNPDTTLLPSHLFWPLEDWDGGSATDLDDMKLENRAGASCVVLTLDARRDSMSVLLVGGGRYGYPLTGTDGAEIIIYSDTGSAITSSGWTAAGTMTSDTGRWNLNAVHLPNGQVLVIGGEVRSATNQVTAQNHDCEIFTPNASETSGSWAAVDTVDVNRGHHSVALLLPDGRVFSAAHETGEGTQEKNYQIFYPPYLFTSASEFAARETIESSPDTVYFGLPFEIAVQEDSAEDIDEVVLMRPGAPTHATDFSQGRVRLSHTAVPGDATGARLIVSAPKDSTYAPAGYYMLFVLADGVPSEAAWVTIQGGGSYTVGDGESVTWGADVWLEQDFQIEAGGKLTILPGTTVHADANQGIGILTQGQLLAEGTEADPITFTSMNGTGGAGAWDGLLFDLEGCVSTAYGYAGCLQPVSSVEHARIEDASYGIVLEDLCAPNLANLEFEDITDDRHIFLKSDAVIPQGYWAGTCNTGSFTWVPTVWDLGGGTRVVASTTEVNDAWVGVEDKNDLIVYGKLFTDGSSATGDQVFFAPDDTTDVTSTSAGRDWGGILLTNFSKGSRLRWADISYAANPLFIYYADSLTEIEHSRIHHFAEVGIWAQGSQGTGGVIDSCVVDRGDEDFNPSLGETGIYLDQADQFGVVRSQVSLEGLNTTTGGTGISVRYGKTFCEATPPPTGRSLLLQDNYVLGPGRDVDEGAGYTGLQTNWVCGSLDRDVDILENVFAGWKFAGLEFVQTADVQVSCNFSIGNRDGVDIYRDAEPTGSAIRFKDNRLEATKRGAAFFALRTNDAVKTKLGPSQADRGKNRLNVHVEDTWFIFENDTTPTDTLNALDNFWYADTLLDAAADADTVKIKGRISPDSARVLVTSYETDDSSLPACWPDTTGLGLPAMMIPRRAEPTSLGDPVALNAVVPGEPTTLELGRPFPNPNRAGTVLQLAVPRDAIGTFEIAIFDVRGRKVWGSTQVVPRAGRYRVEWDGRDAARQRVTDGVYFLRLLGPGAFVETRKITLLR